ncbi:MAG: YlzJ-like family protein [Negativicutes bacterium]|nr:YlzJ-like family protein [Negativicutes bacterium]
MIVWTVMPLDLVFGQEAIPASYEEIVYCGVRMLVEKAGPYESRIVRLLSTDPAVFLRPELQPGRIVTYKPY